MNWRMNLCLFLYSSVFVIQNVLVKAIDKELQPNIILILADDLGYGDLGSYGSPTISTPNIDKLAMEGVKFTQYYVAAPICTPSRSSMLTGKLPVRNGIYANFTYPLDDIFRVFYPSSVNCLSENEVTLADALSDSGSYSTAMVGKWHIGHNPELNCLPGNKKQGFDFFYGLPYSHEEGYPGPLPEALVFPPVPLLCDDVYVEQPYNGTDLTFRYTTLMQDMIWRYADGQGVASDEQLKLRPSLASIASISGLELASERLDHGHQDFSKPFFIHLAYENPHVPLFLSYDYEASGSTSRRGMYGDAVEEMDRSIGMIMESLESSGLADNTVIMFASDNGAWTNPTNGISTRPVKGMSVFDGGSNLPFFEGKGSTWEGGVRVPAILWGRNALPVESKGRTVRAPVSAMDMFPTLLDMAGVSLSTEEEIDGVSLMPLLNGTDTRDPHECIYLWRERDLYAIRCGAYKAHFITRSGFDTSDAGTVHDPPVLYNVDYDTFETMPLDETLDENYETQLEYMVAMASEHIASVVKAPSLYLAQNFTLMPCCARDNHASPSSNPVSEMVSKDLSKYEEVDGTRSAYDNALKHFFSELVQTQRFDGTQISSNALSPLEGNVGIWWDKCVCDRPGRK